MKITIAANSRFWLFDLAKFLNEKKHLDKLITTYPKFKIREWGIPDDRVISFFFLEIISRLSKYFPYPICKFLEQFQHYLFDLLTSFFLNLKTEIFHGLSSSSLITIRKAKRNKIISILARGSTHVLFQDKLLEREYSLLKIKRNDRSFFIKNELKEYQLSDYVSIPSKFVKNTFLNYKFNKKKLLENPFGVDTQLFKPLKKVDKKFRIIFSGTLCVRKGSHYLLKAINELSIKNYEFIHAGTIDSDFKILLNNFNLNNIRFIGHIDQKNLNKYYSQSSIFVFPSLEEGLANVILQAMSCGLPVICTPNSGGENLIKNKVEGYIVPPRNHKILKNKIEYLYYHPDIRKKMSKAARKKIVSNFSWSHYGTRFINDCQNIINNRL